MRPGGWRQVLLRGGIFGGTSFQFFAHAGGVVVAKAALCGVGQLGGALVVLGGSGVVLYGYCLHRLEILDQVLQDGVLGGHRGLPRGEGVQFQLQGTVLGVSLLQLVLQAGELGLVVFDDLGQGLYGVLEHLQLVVFAFSVGPLGVPVLPFLFLQLLVVLCAVVLVVVELVGSFPSLASSMRQPWGQLPVLGHMDPGQERQIAFLGLLGFYLGERHGVCGGGGGGGVVDLACSRRRRIRRSKPHTLQVMAKGQRRAKRPSPYCTSTLPCLVLSFRGTAGKKTRSSMHRAERKKKMKMDATVVGPSGT